MNHFKVARQKAGISQNQLAQMVGVALSTVSNWERGRTYPSIEVLKKVAKITDASTDYLLNNTDGRVYCRRCGSWFVPMGEKDMNDLYYCPYCGDKNFTKEKGDINC